MSLIRPLKSVIEPVALLEGAGVKVKRTIASRSLDYLDPFLLLDHMGSDDPRDYAAGFPMHPHRGIETVTYVLEGAVAHRDSLGNEGTLTAGDVQWMTSGSGIIHEEMPEPVDGRMEGFQLWVNLPAELKMSPPGYQEFKASELPVVQLNGATIKVIAGTVQGMQGPVKEIAADPVYIDVELEPEGQLEFPVKKGHNVFAYLFQGSLVFENPVESVRLLVFGDGDAVQVRAGRMPARFLLVAGAPLGEPVVRYGPFVMNTRAEIKQALSDLENGTFVKNNGQ